MRIEEFHLGCARELDARSPVLRDGSICTAFMSQHALLLQCLTLRCLLLPLRSTSLTHLPHASICPRSPLHHARVIERDVIPDLVLRRAGPRAWRRTCRGGGRLGRGSLRGVC